MGANINADCWAWRLVPHGQSYQFPSQILGHPPTGTSLKVGDSLKPPGSSQCTQPTQSRLPAGQLEVCHPEKGRMKVNTRDLQLLHFGLFLGIYLAALLGNGLNLTAVACDHHLHTPMYLFLLNLALLDLGSITTTVPKAMTNSLWDTRAISFFGCATQLFIMGRGCRNGCSGQPRCAGL
uniref:G-protein coupled receptors family 1 profile domain-containing protein n=1 Tax=Anser cygnoides TaxID=8845 RepID=A0A8B9DNU9_ANSCY